MTVGTHNGLFHSDEIIAIAIINTNKKSKVSIIRSRNPEKLKEADILVDVGGKFDGIRFFDHHQLRDGDNLYGLSSAGMVVMTLPLPNMTTEKRGLIQAVDQRDTRVGWNKDGEYEIVFNAVNDCNKLDIESTAQDKIFKTLVGLFTDYFGDKITYTELQKKVIIIGNKNKKIKNDIMRDRFKKVVKIGMNGSIPIYKHENLEYVDTQFFGDTPFIFLSHDAIQQNYSVITNTKYSKIICISEKVFVHANGFFAKTNSLDNLVLDIEEV